MEGNTLTNLYPGRATAVDYQRKHTLLAVDQQGAPVLGWTNDGWANGQMNPQKAFVGQALPPNQ